MRLLWSTVLLGLGVIALAMACTEITNSTVVCDATVDSTGTVTEWRSTPPGEEELCWRVYGDSLAPALGGAQT